MILTISETNVAWWLIWLLWLAYDIAVLLGV